MDNNNHQQWQAANNAQFSALGEHPNPEAYPNASSSAPFEQAGDLDAGMDVDMEGVQQDPNQALIAAMMTASGHGMDVKDVHQNVQDNFIQGQLSVGGEPWL